MYTRNLTQYFVFLFVFTLSINSYSTVPNAQEEKVADEPIEPIVHPFFKGKKIKEYLNSTILEALEEKCIKNKTCKYTILCYNNGLWFVCPNPKDPYRAKALKEQYHKGFYIDCKTFKMAEEDFENDENWNS